jgi:Ca-activated chloride channel family protein
MDFSLFHFAQPQWLWGLAVIPMLLVAYVVVLRRSSVPHQLEAFADKHLLPHLVRQRPETENRFWRFPLVWPLALILTLVALAGPQWRYTDTQIFKPENDLVIVLDMSSTMNAADVKPSRLARAREEISDLLDANKGLTIGLVAYAAVPHMVVPLTDDMNTIRNLLPSLDTSLITIDGDRLKPALAMASGMLKAEPGHDKSILVVSDGDFSENNAADLVQAADGAKVYTMGIGSAAGVPVPMADGSWAKDKSGRMLIDRLHVDQLALLARTGNGIYIEATYDNSDTRMLLNHIGDADDNQKLAGRTVRVWDEGFYVPVLLLALLLLPLFRKRAPPILLLIFAFALSAYPAQAADTADWFRNPAQQGQDAFAQGHYDAAAQKFTDPYQQGVAAYKAGHYAQAAALFKTASGETAGTAATYNLGNAQLMDGQPQMAIDSYQAVLKQNPSDASAKHNLEIAQKMLQQKKQQERKQQPDQNKQSSGQQKEGQTGGQDKQGQQTQQNGQQQSSPQNQSQQTSQSPGKESPSQTAGNGQKDGQDRAADSKLPSTNQQQSNQPQAAQNSSGQTSAPSPLNTQKEGQTSQADRQKTLSPTDTNNSMQASEHSKPTNEQPSDNPGTAANQNKSLQNNLPAPQKNSASASIAHSQRDIDADQWLNHIQSDPGSFLRNQFMIEEQDNRQDRESPPS